MPGREGSVTQEARSDPLVPMETGGAGDGQSWVEQAEASAEEEWRRDRPAKHHQSSPRRWGVQSTNSFPLQDSEGRQEVVQQLYWHTGELVPACHDVAAQGMACHHPNMETGVAKSLNNQVLCMISEYHLMCLSQGSSYISPVLPEAARDLLPSMEEYLAGGDFQGTRDLSSWRGPRPYGWQSGFITWTWPLLEMGQTPILWMPLSMAWDLCWSSS